MRVTASSNVKRMRQAKLLIVDDNRELCELLEGILRKEGYEQVRLSIAVRVPRWRFKEKNQIL